MFSYDTTKTIRGHVTGVIEWVDVAANTSYTRLMQYDRFGNLVRAQMSCCNQKSFGYSQANYWSQPTSVTIGDPQGLYLNSTQDYDFNASVPTSSTDPNQLMTTYGYDGMLRNTSVGLPTGATGGVNYNDATLTITKTVQYLEDYVYKTISTSAVRDGWGRTIQELNQHGGQVNISYDAMGWKASRTNPFGQGGQPGPATTYLFDLLGRIKTMTLPDGNTVQTSYSGNTVTTTDQVGRKILRETDGLGRLVKVIEQGTAGALTQHTTYTYNLLNKVVEVNQGSQVRRFKYDDKGRLLYERIPEHSATINDGTGTLWSCKYTYTDFDAVSTKQDARGVLTTYTYDSLHRPTSISYNTGFAPGVATTPSVTYTYDNSNNSSTKGLTLSVSVGSGYSESYTYDSLNRIQQVAHTIDTQTYITNLTFNEIGQPKRIGHLFPEYDNSGRLSKVKNNASVALLFNTTYNIAGQVTGDTLLTGGEGNNTQESYTYDQQRMQFSSQTVTKGATTLMSLTYGYQAQAGQMGAGTTTGNAGQLINVSGQLNGYLESATYTYDLTGRLATSSQTTNQVSAQRRFSYDRWGNRTGVWDAVTGGSQIQSVVLAQQGGVPTNRLTSVTTNGVLTSYSYDAAGNVINDGTHSYVYDAENRMVSADSGAYTYAYDHQNRRVKKSVGSSVTHYVWEEGQVIAEYNGSTGTQQIAYYYFGNRMFAKAPTGQPIQFLLTDRLSVRLAVDNLGSVIGRQGHLPFGEEIGGANQQDKHHFTSYERDSELGHDYAVNRRYSSGVGRFGSTDPNKASGKLLTPQSWNRYNYVYNNPANFIDPKGLDLLAICFEVVEDKSGGDGPPNWGVTSQACGYVGTGGFFAGGGGGGSESGRPVGHSAPLKEPQAVALANAMNALINYLYGNISESCQKNVIDKLAESMRFDIASFQQFLLGGADFYDGTTSTTLIPGIITTERAFRAGLGIVFYGSTVSEHFNNPPPGIQVNALASLISPTLMVFFRPDTIDLSNGGVNPRNFSLLFHEALHGFGASQGGFRYVDQDLRDAFGIGSNGDISDYIKRNCF